jgi:hypothetical protein
MIDFGNYSDWATRLRESMSIALTLSTDGAHVDDI